jgi:putative DNA primase/helicase
MSTEEIIKQDIMYSYAYAIRNGEANGKFLYCLEDDKFYSYKFGYWEGLFDVDFLGHIEENMKKITKFSIGRRKQITDNFKSIARKKLSEFNWSELINMKNGMLNPYDGTLSEHDPNYYSTNRLPYIYDKDAKCDLWLKTLGEIFENDVKKINILQEYIGYCLTRETKHHKALLLLGESRSGKSTIIQTIRKVIGDNNCSSVPLKYLSNAQYTAMLINKLVNIDTDVSSKAAEFEAEFKTITSGEPVSVNQKYVAAFDFVPYCKIILAANIFPRITDHSSAFYNRLILIPCDKVFSYEEQNRDLPKQLLNELPGILNWSIEGLKRLNSRQRFEDLQFMKDAVNELENKNNPAQVFFQDHIETDVSGEVYIEKSELYEKYKNWSQKNGMYPLSVQLFTDSLYKKYHKFTPKSTNDSISGKRIWRNIRYVEIKGISPVKTEIAWQDNDPAVASGKTSSPTTIEVGSRQGDINWGE